MPIKQFKLTALSAAVVMGLAACGGSDDNYEPTVSAEVAAEGTQWQPMSGSVSATDPNGDPMTYSASVVTPEGGTAPGTVEINESGEFTYTPLRAETATIEITVSDGELSTTETVTIDGTAISGDPLAYQQWHLNNTGQKTFTQTQAQIDFLVNNYGWTEEAAREAFFDESIYVPGEDMNVIEAHAQGAFGQGMIVGVVDSGLEIGHPDLQANIAPNKSLNFAADAIDKMDPTNRGAVRGDHGTSVAGLIAAVAGNELGGRGVAPQAQVFGANYLAAQTTLNSGLSHGLPGSGITESDPLIAYNRSYGISYPAALYTYPTDEAFEKYVATDLRNGLGAINVKSAGNSFDSGSTGLCQVNGAVSAGVTCMNGNMDPSNANFYTTTIAAVNSDGKHTSYSTAGSNTFVAAPAGEYGEFAPAMITTDQSTCLQGYSGFPYQDYLDGLAGVPGYYEAFRGFNAPGHDENPGCHFTSTFNGTSSAAPNTSGVVALIGSANPALSAREIRHIMANTADQVDAEDEGVVLPVNGGEFVADPGWIENAAGYAFNLKYGFGRVNAGAAVTMAKDMEAGALGELIETAWMDVSPETAVNVPDNNAEGASYSFTVEDDMTLEGLQFRLTVSNADFNGSGCSFYSTAGSDLAVEVTSPAGTTTQLLSGRQDIIVGAEGFCSPYILENTVFLANAFYGESLAGEWTVRLVDTNGSDYTLSGLPVTNNSVPSVFEAVSVRAFGH
ncbi:S8 family serine peptidase [Idiomarina sp. HP20-50]|uniref:S8 family serine peptidase n=1 Tax=Idiomarina sp. HP20-50 TaxID=3070813 RepID=UPI00294ACA98|nr:S8 family serine peptidase [Idiomarina sp. HP20-50]MDV6316125.1 S8 family serine peptidase [Idiomarina sp. HP20-50]